VVRDLHAGDEAEAEIADPGHQAVPRGPVADVKKLYPNWRTTVNFFNRSERRVSERPRRYSTSVSIWTMAT
jgi:hypothetical protein